MSRATMKHIAAMFVLALCVSSAFAGNLTRRYKDWPSTPQGYFMTNAERAQWPALQTDEEAEKFINDFVARRGGEAFVKEVSQNAMQADKFLSIGKTPGSTTLRGKMMILLGPSAPAAITKKKKSGEMHIAPGTSMGDFGGPAVQDMQAASNDPGNSTTFIYAKKGTPAGVREAGQALSYGTTSNSTFHAPLPGCLCMPLQTGGNASGVATGYLHARPWRAFVTPRNVQTPGHTGRGA